jgi:general stress protein 26
MALAMMDKRFIYRFLSENKLTVLATKGDDCDPHAALVCFAATPDLELVIDTTRSSRKYAALVHNPQVACVIGWDDETTLQYEGTAVELDKDNRYRDLYFTTFPDAEARAHSWPDIVHFKIVPRWIRYSKFTDPIVVEELTFA